MYCLPLTTYVIGEPVCLVGISTGAGVFACSLVVRTQECHTSLRLVGMDAALAGDHERLRRQHTDERATRLTQARLEVHALERG
jgi:hypothetical protein